MGDLSEKDSSQAVKVIGSDSVGKETTPVRSTSQGDMGVTDILSGTAVEGQLSIGPTPTLLKIGLTNLPGRKFVMFEAPENMRWGFTNSITASSGFSARKGSIVRIKASASRDVYLVSASNISAFCAEVI